MVSGQRATRPSACGTCKTRELIVTLFRGTDGEWVMWTPQGYYTGSPGADKIVGWQINKGRRTRPTTSAPTSCASI